MTKRKTTGVLKNASRIKPVKLPEAAKTAASASRTGPKPTLNTDQIARAAIAIADSHGLEAVSMQRVASAVGVTTMALYRYFSSKTDLIELMIDIAGGPAPELTVLPRKWRPSLAEWTRQCSSIYRRHPWFLQATMTPGRKMGSNELGWLNAAFTVLSRTGLKPHEQHQAFLVLMGHIRSSAEFALAAAQHHSGSSEPAMSIQQHRGTYPALAAAIKSGAFVQSRENDLDFGLECILRGIETITRRRADY